MIDEPETSVTRATGAWSAATAAGRPSSDGRPTSRADLLTEDRDEDPGARVECAAKLGFSTLFDSSPVCCGVYPAPSLRFHRRAATGRRGRIADELAG
jgi:hypothetical protein